MTRPRPHPDRPVLWLAKYLTLALTLPASVAAGYLAGALADHWLHVPVLRAVGIVLGMMAGIVQILKQLNQEAADAKRAGPPRR